MLDLALESTTTDLLGTVEEFATHQLREGASAADTSGRPAAEAARLASAIGVAPGVPEEFGGDGRPTDLERLLVAERLGNGDAGATLELLASDSVVAIVHAVGTSAQQQTWLPGFAADPQRPATVLYHEGFGRGPSELRTRARRTSGGWVLDGRKVAVVRPLEAELAVVVAADDDGLASFVLDRSHVARLRVLRDDAAAGKLGLRAARTADVALEGVEVPDGHRLEPSDPLALHRAVALHRLVPAAVALGVGRAAVQYAIGYTQDRTAFGRPVFDFQGVAFPLVDATMALDACRLALLALVEDLPTATRATEVERRTTSVAHRAHRAATEAARLAINCLGGHGYLVDHPVERWFRDAATLAGLDFDPLALDFDVV